MPSAWPGRPKHLLAHVSPRGWSDFAPRREKSLLRKEGSSRCCCRPGERRFCWGGGVPLMLLGGLETPCAHVPRRSLATVGGTQHPQALQHGWQHVPKLRDSLSLLLPGLSMGENSHGQAQAAGISCFKAPGLQPGLKISSM